MPSNPGPAVPWRRALFLSLGVHLAIISAGWLWPPRHDFSPPRVEPRSAGIRLQSSPNPFDHDASAEESSDEYLVDATLNSGLLIEPNLPPSKATSGPAAHLATAAAAATQSDGKKATGARFFQVESNARRIVYVVDASSSMGKDGLWTRASRELMQSVDTLPPDVLFQVIVYHSRARALIPARPGWLSPDDATRMQIKDALSALFPEGTTMHAPALNLALAMRPDALFFLTDADDLTPDLLAQVERWNQGNSVIHAFELNGVDRGPTAPMRILARRHGGEYRLIER